LNKQLIQVCKFISSVLREQQSKKRYGKEQLIPKIQKQHKMYHNLYYGMAAHTIVMHLKIFQTK